MFYYFLIKRYCFIIYVVIVSASILLGSFPFSRFPVQSLLFTLNPVLPWFLRAVPRAVHGGGGGGSRGWLGGVLGLVRVFSRACSLICQQDSRFHIPARLPFLQGTGELISADHLWIGPRNSNCNPFVYLPPYLQKRVLPFYLPWLESIEIARPGLPSLAFRPLR